MKYFLRSMFFFIALFFKKREVDVIFYYSQHFNRGEESKNMFFDYLYSSCSRNNISYLVIEEPDFSSSKLRNEDAISFDFVYLIIIFLRKLKMSDNTIGKILSKTILRGLKFNNYIVLSQSMLSIFRCINPNAKLFDLQHGIIYSNKLSYIENREPAKNLKNNRVNLLLFGEGFRSLLLENDSSRYFADYSHVIGFPRMVDSILHRDVNKNILVSLQFTHDHTEQQNKLIASELEEFIENHQNYNFFLRNHPRYNNEINLDRFFKFNNVQESDTELLDCFKRCSLHLTSYSTTSFESARFGIPTIFLTALSDEFNMFDLDFNYPIESNLEFIEQNYSQASFKVIDWEREFFDDFDESQFISLLL